MASCADGGRIVHRVATQANAHGRHAGRLGHRLHLGHLSMARLALDSRVQMLAVRPVYARKHLIDSNPRNGLARGRIRGELLDCRFLLANLMVAGHASRRRRIRHELSGRGIGVAARARQPQRQMRLVAVRDRLLRRHVSAQGSPERPAEPPPWRIARRRRRASEALSHRKKPMAHTAI